MAFFMSADSKLGSSLAAAPPRAEFSFWQAFARHWRSSVRYYGLRHTIAQLARAAYRFFRDLLPDRRQIKYGDLDYDFDHNVDTTRANVGLRAQLIAALTGHQYFPSEPWLFEEMMHALPIRFQDFTFVDLGSGKGRVLLMAASCGFKRIVGVEFMPEWHRAAEENIRNHGAHCSAEEKAAVIESHCMDARDFEFPAGPLVVYLFNPFPEPVLAAVLDRLRQSVLNHPRPVFLAYRYPEFEGLLRNCGWLEKVAGAQQWAIYEASRPHEPGAGQP
jgi:SAM-dependent methyltransferase